MKNDIEKFSESLTELMQIDELTISNLSQSLFCDGNAVSKWKQARHFPDYKRLCALADYFKCSVDFVLGLTDKKEFVCNCPKQSFAERLIILMKKSTLTQYKIAKRLKISQSSISEWLSQGIVPRTQTLIDLSRLFGTTVEYVIGRGELKGATIDYTIHKNKKVTNIY